MENSPENQVQWKGLFQGLNQPSNQSSQEELSPEKQQTVLVQRATQLATPLDQDTSSEFLNLLSFVLGTERFLLDINYIREVMFLEQLVPVPDTPVQLAGVTTLRGDLLAVMDLRPLFRLAPSEQDFEDQTSHALIIGRNQDEYALQVDEVSHILQLPRSELLPVPASLPKETKEFLQGVTREVWHVLDGKRLITDERFTIQQR